MSTPIPNEEFIKTLTKQQIFNMWVERGEEIKKVYGENATLKMQVRDLKGDFKSIYAKLGILYRDFRFDNVR